MGSRAIAVLARDEAAAERRFGVADGSTGTVYTRTGRPFFDDTAVMTDLVGRLRGAAAPLFERLETDWLVLDCELLPWSAKALGLIRGQYAAVGAAARHALPALGAALDAAAARGLDVADLSARTAPEARPRPRLPGRLRGVLPADRRPRRRDPRAVPGAGRRGPRGRCHRDPRVAPRAAGAAGGRR